MPIKNSILLIAYVNFEGGISVNFKSLKKGCLFRQPLEYLFYMLMDQTEYPFGGH